MDNPIITILAAVALIALATTMFMAGWNGFMFLVFGLPQITYLQSFCALLLLALVAGLFRGGKKDG